MLARGGCQTGGVFHGDEQHRLGALLAECRAHPVDRLKRRGIIHAMWPYPRVYDERLAKPPRRLIRGRSSCRRRKWAFALRDESGPQRYARDQAAFDPWVEHESS